MGYRKDLSLNTTTRARARQRFLDAVARGEPILEAARRFGIPRRTAYRLVSRSAVGMQRELMRIEYLEAFKTAMALGREDPGLSASTIRDMLRAMGLARIPSERAIRARLKAGSARHEDDSRACQMVHQARVFYFHGGEAGKVLAARLLSEARRIAPKWLFAQAPGVFGRSRSQLWRIMRLAESAPFQR